MTLNGEPAKSIAALMEALRRKVEQPVPGPALDPLAQMVYAFCRYDAGRPQADRAYLRLTGQMVDLNDLRVSDTSEIAEALGPRYPRATDRAERLKRSLNAVFRAEHKPDLSRLTTLAKREARAYLEGLDGMVPFVSASVMVLSLGAHAVAVDDRLLQRLIADGVLAEETDLPSAQSLLERCIMAEDAAAAHDLLREYADKPIKLDLDSAASRKSKRKHSTSRKATPRVRSSSHRRKN